MNRIRRTIITLTLTGAFLPMLTLTNEAAAGPHGPCSGQRYYVTQRLGPLIREARVKNLIRCVFNYGGIGDEAEFAITIAGRESHLIPWVRSWSGCWGLFQHMGRYWPGRAHALPRRFFPHWPNSSAFGARANAWAAMQIVRAGGWSAWATA